jgi:hypothetical protein
MTNSTVTLNAANEALLTEFAQIQQRVDANQACATLEQECEYLYARGQERLWLQDMAGQLTGPFIGRIEDVVPECNIWVYPEGTTKRQQSLNASLKMVALHSLLMSGFTEPKTISTALQGWIADDSISIELDTDAVALDLVTAMIKAELLNSETGRALTEDGAFYEAYGATPYVQDLRVKTMRNLWERAQPRMQPMRHKITWVADGKGNAICEIKNLKLVKGKSKVSEDFIKAANFASHTGYVINSTIRAELSLWLEAAEMPELPEDEKEALRVVNAHEDKVRIVEELMMLPIHETMYFPHTADWRGRLYARGGLTHFQSIKACKAIFDFAKPAKITDPKGLYLHVANAHGMDKVSITNRIQWVRENINEIVLGGLANDIYAKRAALALAEYLATGETGVICHIDGTCNGTQWTSAIYRDEKTAKLVNVRKSSHDALPFDLYGVIAERALKLSTGLERDALDNFGRDLTKAPIMVLGYGASEQTILTRITEFLAERGHKASPKKLQKAIMTAIKLEAPALTKLTDNLKRVLKQAPTHTATWNAFDLTVVTECFNTECFNLYGTKYTAKLSGKAIEDTDALARGISPNYVHSLDSAHVREILRLAGDNGVYLSCIHDSIGSPANKVLEINEAIRTTFHTLNQTDLVENIYNALGASYTDQRGKLDIDEVLEATYIFS